MLDFIFTIDYEIYGNGKGSLKELVFEPSSKLIGIFKKHKLNLVFFIEVAELEMIEASSADPFLNPVKEQINFLKENGFEIGLHIHPQWYRGRFSNGSWQLDYKEYNLSLLEENRIKEILTRSLNYLRSLVNDPQLTPIVYRAGNWLINPASKIAPILSSLGIKIDSSVYKGGYQRYTGVDFRHAPKKMYYWEFSSDANVPEKPGVLIEMPIYTKLIPTWKFFRGRRLSLEKSSQSSESFNKLFLRRLSDFFRWKVPVKFDFCRLNYQELKKITDDLIEIDKKNPLEYKPIVLIGHTKDKPDAYTIDLFLNYLKENNIRITSFSEAYRKICNG